MIKVMKNYIIITADENDGDNVTAINEISDENLKLIEPVIKALNKRKAEFKKSNNWNDRRNWETGKISNTCTPEQLYLDEELITEDELGLFMDYVPMREYGIHTIEEIKVLKVKEEIILLNL